MDTLMIGALLLFCLAMHLQATVKRLRCELANSQSLCQKLSSDNNQLR